MYSAKFYSFRLTANESSSYGNDYSSNLFREYEDTSINHNERPINYWTLQEYYLLSCSYHFHDIKYPERKLQFSSFGLIQFIIHYCISVIYCTPHVRQFHFQPEMIYFLDQKTLSINFSIPMSNTIEQKIYARLQVYFRFVSQEFI